jgi:hypothetical protein
MAGEVWRYTGAAAGPDEFIVRDRLQVTLTAAGPSTGNAVSGVVDRNKCVCFITGKTCTQTSQNNMAEMGAIAYLDANGDLTVERGSGSTTLVVYVTVVEFTGSNWSVGYARTTFADGQYTVYADSRGNTGGTQSIDWDTSMLVEVRQSGGDGSNDAIEDMSFCALPGASATQVQLIKDSTSANTGAGFIYVLQHPNLSIGRTTANKNISNNGTYVSETFPSITLSDVEEAGVEWTVFSDGTGTAHGRGSLNARLTNATTLQSWVHRSGNTGTYRYGVADFAAINGVAALIINSVGGDDVVGNAEQNVLIVASGGGFGASQGAGSVLLSENSDGTGTSVSLNIDSWSDTQIQVDIAAGALADSNAFIYVTTDAAEVGVRAVQVGSPPETYAEIIDGLLASPDHHWPFQNSYADRLGGATANASAESGTSFSTDILVKGDTHSLLLDSDTDYTNPVNQSTMNDTSSATRRYMGGWIMLDSIAKNLVVIWEEGAQVNNFAFLNGFGNALMFQAADAAGDYSQAYAGIKLTPNRPYFILGEWNGSGFKSGDGALWLDGVRQTGTNGLPWEVNAFPSHTGSISWGHNPGEDLKVGDDRGVDATVIAFVSPNQCLYAHWFSWINAGLSDDDIRVELFEKVALADQTISSGTEIAMQTAVDALANTTIPDWPCGIEIASCVDGDFAITLDDVQFNERISIPIRYMGSDTLTITLLNGSNPDAAKCSTPYGGTIVFETPAQLTLTGLQPNTEVRVYEQGTDTEIGGVEDSGTTFSLSVQTPAVDVTIFALGFLPIELTNVDTTSDVSLPIQQRVDRVYDNPAPLVSDLFLAEFNGANGTAISAYAPDTPAAGFNSDFQTGSHQIFNNALAVLTTTSSAADCVSWQLNAPVPGTYSVEAEIIAPAPGSFAGPGIVACDASGQPGFQEGYLFYIYNNQVLLDKRVGYSWEPGLDSAAFSFTEGTRYVLRLDVTPTGLTGYIDDVQVVSSSDTALRGAYFGIGCYLIQDYYGVNDEIAEYLRVYE